VKGLCGGELGLSKLANILRIEREGGAHQAGSDSLLTILAVAKVDVIMFGIVFVIVFRQILNFFFVKIECGLYFLDCFDVLMSKIIFKK